MSAHLHNSLRTLGVSVCLVTVPAEVVELDRDHAARLGVLNFEIALSKRELQPVIPVELANQVALRVHQGKLLGVSGEHNLVDVDLEGLLFACFLVRIKQNVVHCAFAAAHNRLFAVLVHENGLLLHDDLLFETQVCLAKNENFTLTGHINIILAADCREHLDRFGLGTDSGH